MHGVYTNHPVIFSDREKESCLPLIEHISQLGKKSIKEGLMSLDKHLSEEHNWFLKIGVELICNAIPPDVTQKILMNLINADNYTGGELLEKILVVEGVLYMQQGINVEMIESVLLSMLGYKYYKQPKWGR
jgi:flagellar motor component MotA